TVPLRDRGRPGGAPRRLRREPPLLSRLQRLGPGPAGEGARRGRLAVHRGSPRGGPRRVGPDPVGRHPSLAGGRSGDAPARRRRELMLDPTLLESRIKAALPDAQVTIRDLTGTGDHFEAKVVSSAFEGKTLVDQHAAVYA